MSRFRDLMIAAAAAEPCLTFNIIAEEGQTVSVQPRIGGTITVDFGDGIQTIPNNSTVTHTYSAGNHTLKVYGATCTNCYIRGTANIASSNEKWQYLGSQFTNASYMFRDLANSELMFKTLPPYLTSASGMFFNSTQALLPLTAMPDTVIDIGNFASNCANALLPLVSLPSALQSANLAFSNCRQAQLPLRALPPLLQNGQTMFGACLSAQMQISSLPETLTNATGMFQRCGGVFTISKLPNGIAQCANMFNDYSLVGQHLMDLDAFVANAPAGGYPSVTSINNMFNCCTEVTGSRSAFLALFPNLTSSTGAFNGTSTTE